MSQENLELVKLGFEAFERGDVDAMREGCHPDVVIVQPPEVPDAKCYEGHAGIAAAFEDWPSQWEDFQIEMDFTRVRPHLPRRQARAHGHVHEPRAGPRGR